MNFLEIKTSLLEDSREEMRQHLLEVENMKQAFAKQLQMMQFLVEDENLSGVKEHIEKLQQDAHLLDGMSTVTYLWPTDLISPSKNRSRNAISP